MNKPSISSMINYCQSFKLFGVFFVAGILLLLGGTCISGAQTQSSEVVVDVLFEADNNDISTETENSLNEHAEALKNNPGTRVVLEGYSDSTGREDYNLELSEYRAQSVRDYLVNLGVSENKISIVPKGGTERFAEGTTPEALASNRRVRIIYEIPVEAPVEEAQIEVQTTEPRPEQPEPPEPIEIPEQYEAITQEPEPEDAAQPEMEETDLVPEELSEPVNISKPVPTSAPLPPSPAPPTPPPSLLNTIGSEIKESAPGAIVFDLPPSMRLESTYLIEARVSQGFISELSSALKNHKEAGGLKLGEDMLILLSGKGFEIQPYEDSNNSEDIFSKENGAQSQSLSSADGTKWQWYVRPVSTGYQPLLLSVIVDIEEPEYGEMNTEYKVYKKIVEVNPGFIRATVASYWLTSFFILLLIAVVSWVLLGKFNLL